MKRYPPQSTVDLHKRKEASAGFRAVQTLLLMVVIFIFAMGLPGLAQAKPSFSTIAVDARTGKIITGIDIDGLRHPASLTKMMTLYLVFQDLKSGRIKLSTPLVVSQRAANMAPSKIGFKAGATIAVNDAIKALVTKSANDVAAAVAENLGGNEASFAERMTRTARALGMSRTTYRNASGLPNDDQWTTARDMATLGLRLQHDFPQYYPYFRLTGFKYRGQIIRTHNKLLLRYKGTDGIKTGYIAASGFNVTTSATRGGKRVVGVVMGAPSGAARDLYMMRMLDKVFPKCVAGRSMALMPGGTPVSVPEVEAPAEKAVAQDASGMAASGEDEDLGTAADTAPEATQLVAEAPVKKGKKRRGGKNANDDKADTAYVAPHETKVLEAKMADASGNSAVTPPRNISSSVNAQLPAQPVQKAQAPQQTLAPQQTQVTPSPQDSQPQQPANPLPGSLPFAVKKTPDAGGTPVVNGSVVTAAAPQAVAADTPKDTTWNIQIGSFAKKEDARARLQSMRTSGYKFLKDKAAYTVEVKADDKTMFRARFSGFTQKSAGDACKNLARKGYECQAVAPQP